MENNIHYLPLSTTWDNASETYYVHCVTNYNLFLSLSFIFTYIFVYITTFFSCSVMIYSETKMKRIWLITSYGPSPCIDASERVEAVWENVSIMISFSWSYLDLLFPLILFQSFSPFRDGRVKLFFVSSRVKLFFCLFHKFPPLMTS
jgi:hypothetical protein